MLNINWIIEQIEKSEYNPSCNIFNNKAHLVETYGQGKPCIQFDYAANEISTDDIWLINNALSVLSVLPSFKVKDSNRIGCFDYTRIDWEDMSYGKDKKKFTRVLSEVISHFDTMNDITLAYMEKSDYPHDYAARLYQACKSIGHLPRQYESNPLDMTPAIFVSWLGEQITRMRQGKKTTYFIDFRPEASLLAGNGRGFRSCYGLPYFPNREADCYNNSPSAYAWSANTAILYSLADDEHSLTNRAWIYFVNGSIYFGRFYGNEISREVCKVAAQKMGFEPSLNMIGLGNVNSIVKGDIYVSDALEIGFGSCVCDYDERINLKTQCISCGSYNFNENDSSDCLCADCRNEGSYCEKCGDLCDQDDMVYIDGYGLCCTDCASQCDDCGDWHLNRHMTDVGGNSRTVMICEHCMDDWTYCEHCQDYERQEDTIYMDNLDIIVCDYCARHYYIERSDCGEWTLKEDASTCSDCGNVLCADCVIECNECGVMICNGCADDELCSTCYNAAVEEEEETSEVQA